MWHIQRMGVGSNSFVDMANVSSFPSITLHPVDTCFCSGSGKERQLVCCRLSVVVGCCVSGLDIMGLHDAGLASVAYFYCDFRDEDKWSHRSLLLSVLSQLSAQSNLRCAYSPNFFRPMIVANQSPVIVR